MKRNQLSVNSTYLWLRVQLWTGTFYDNIVFFICIKHFVLEMRDRKRLARAA